MKFIKIILNAKLLTHLMLIIDSRRRSNDPNAYICTATTELCARIAG